jgi:hypothetical protein
MSSAVDTKPETPKPEEPKQEETPKSDEPKEDTGPETRTYDTPVLLKCDELFGRRRGPSGSGRYNAGEILQAMEELRPRKRRGES